MKKPEIKLIILATIITIFFYPGTIPHIQESIDHVLTWCKLNQSTHRTQGHFIEQGKTKVVLMFDDGWKSVYSHGYPMMNEYGFVGSVGLISSRVKEKEYLSYEEIGKLKLEGWEMLNHTYSHKEGMYNFPDELLSDSQKARQWMERRRLDEGSNILVVPYGEINPILLKMLKEEGYRNVRTSDNVLVLDQEEIAYQPVVACNMLPDLTVQQLQAVLEKHMGTDATILLIFHKIGNELDEAGMTYEPQYFQQILDFLYNHKEQLQVVTYTEALS